MSTWWIHKRPLSGMANPFTNNTFHESFAINKLPKKFISNWTAALNVKTLTWMPYTWELIIIIQIFPEVIELLSFAQNFYDESQFAFWVYVKCHKPDKGSNSVHLATEIVYIF